MKIVEYSENFLNNENVENSENFKYIENLEKDKNEKLDEKCIKKNKEKHCWHYQLLKLNYYLCILLRRRR